MSAQEAETAGRRSRGTGGTQAISRTLAVLNLFRDHAEDLGISEIAGDLSLSVSTVHRIVRALVVEGYLNQDEATGRYSLGRSSVLLGQAAHRSLGLDHAQHLLERLAQDTGESVNLGVRDGNEMVVVISVESKHPLRFHQPPGNRLPVHATAMGKASLAHGALSITEEVAHLDKPLRALTKKTLTSAAKLRDELERIHRCGYSVDNEEAINGVRCVAAPILTSDGELMAAVAVQAPAVRMPDSRVKRISTSVRKTAQAVSDVVTAHHL